MDGDGDTENSSDSRDGIDQNKSSVWFDADNIPHYRASALYSCDNALLAMRLGYEGVRAAPAWLQQRYDAGHDHEPLILEKLRTRFLMTTYGFQHETNLPVGTRAFITGHLDAMGSGEYVFITHRNGKQLGDMHDPFKLDLEPSMVPFVIDAKALSSGSTATWLRGRFDAMPYYGWQQSTYQYGIGGGLRPQPLVMAIKNKDTDDHWVEWFDEPYVGKAQLLAKVLRIEKMYEEGPQALFRDKCAPKMFPCPFFQWHPTEPKADGDSDPVVDTVAVLALAESRAAATRRAKEAEAEITAIDAQIEAEFEGKEFKVALGKLSDNLSSISTSHATYSKIDWGQMEADFPGLHKADYSDTAKSPKLTVKVNAKRKG